MFSHYVRTHATADDLPDYRLKMKDGRRGPVLLMQRRKPEKLDEDIEAAAS